MTSTQRSFSAREFTSDCLDAQEVDLVLVSSGYEERATFIANSLQGLSSRRRVALAFRDRSSETTRANNDNVFSSLHYSLVPSLGADRSEAVHEIDLAVESAGPVCQIVVDYSCMTRVWYAAIIEHVLRRVTRRTIVYFLYAPSEFSEPSPARPNRYVESLRGFSGLSSPNKPTALVLGLGYESERAIGLVNYLEPATTVAFLADPALDKRFVAAAETANEPILRVLKEDRIVRYPLRDLQATSAALESCCLGLTRDYRIIIAPLGPKPFTLLSLLLASNHSTMAVWRVSAGEKGAVKRRKALGVVLGLRVEFAESPGIP